MAGGAGRPLGWSSWNYFASDINETVFMEMADAMVSTGLAKLGYEYINVGARPSFPCCCAWGGLTSLGGGRVAADAGYLTHERDSSGKLVVDSQRFPSGMRKLADHVHSRGLKLGVCAPPTCPAALLCPPRSDSGVSACVADTDLTNRSCGRGPGSFGHYTIDAQTIAHDWDADYLKVRPPPLTYPGVCDPSSPCPVAPRVRMLADIDMAG